MDVMQLDLALRLPEPEKINPPDHRNDKPSVESVAESHALTLHGDGKMASDSD